MFNKMALNRRKCFIRKKMENDFSINIFLYQLRFFIGFLFERKKRSFNEFKNYVSIYKTNYYIHENVYIYI